MPGMMLGDAPKWTGWGPEVGKGLKGIIQASQCCICAALCERNARLNYDALGERQSCLLHGHTMESADMNFSFRSGSCHVIVL